jgi:hypothetical protein
VWVRVVVVIPEICEWFGLKTTRIVCQWFNMKTTRTVSPGLVSKPVATIAPGLTSKPVVEGFPIWASILAATV